MILLESRSHVIVKLKPCSFWGIHSCKRFNIVPLFSLIRYYIVYQYIKWLATPTCISVSVRCHSSHASLAIYGILMNTMTGMVLSTLVSQWCVFSETWSVNILISA